MELNSIKNKINKYSRDKNVSVQTAWDILFFDEFLYRLSHSNHKNKFIFKGGYYLQSILGVETRSTMDIDFKMIESKIDNGELFKIFEEIISYNNEEIKFEIVSLSDIKAETKYGGKTLKISASFYNIRKTFGIDIGFGDVVTPYPIDYIYKPSFKDDEYSILAYSIETSIAEKFETIISRGTNNSRSKDYIDLYLYMNGSFDKELLNAAVVNTFHIRNTVYDKQNIMNTLDSVFNDERQFILFENYRRKNKFASEITYSMCKEAIYKLVFSLKFNEKLHLSDFNIELHLLRHGQDEVEKVGGWSDNHLTPLGVKEVELLLNKLDDNYDLFISSDLIRAIETSNIINNKLNMNINLYKDFREFNNGDLKNLSIYEFKKKYPSFITLNMNEKYHNGETPYEFFERIKKSFLKLINNNKNKKILLVTHGGVITVILSLLNGFPYSNKLKITPKTATLIKLK